MHFNNQLQLKEFLKEKKRIREERTKVVNQFRALGFFIMVSSAICLYQTFSIS